MIGGDAAPVAVVDAGGKTVDVAVPLAARESTEQTLVQQPRVTRHRLEHRQQVLRIAAQVVVETFQTHIPLTPLRQRKTELQAGARGEIGQIAEHDLFLQRDGRGGDHEAFAERLGDRNRGDAIRGGFARAGARLDRGDAALAVRARQHTRDRCDHFALAAPRIERAFAEPGSVAELNALFERGVEGGFGHRRELDPLKSA